jgi:VWFA-related protein
VQGPVFRGGVNLVPVDVVVTDKDDHPITDLTAADFTLTQDGRPQQIQTFQFISIPLAHREIDANRPPPPPADVATNAPPSDRSRLFVIVFDDQHIIENDITHVKQAITAFVQALSPEDEVAMIFTGRSDVSVNFTHDPARLLKALDGVKVALGFGIDAKGNDPSAKMANGEALFHANLTVDAIRSATDALVGSAFVRKAIILVSGFSPIPSASGEGHVLQLYLEDAYAAARRADVPIYTLDPRGIPNALTASRYNGRDHYGGGGVAEQQDHLRNIAESTGGRALMNNLDVASLVNEVVADNGSFYLLGYAPTPAVQDGKVHAVKVNVSRPGAKVRGRSEYVAPTPASATAPTTQQALDTALGRGVDVSGLTLHAFATPVASTAKGMTAVVTIDVTYPSSGDAHATITDDLKVKLLALDPDGKVRTSTGHDWHVSGMAGADHAMTVRIDEVVDLPAQPSTLRIGVASPRESREGTIQLPLEVVNPASGKLQIGGVAIGVVGDRMLASGFDRVRPLLPFQPTTTRTFAMADTLRIFAPVFWTTKDAAADVTVTAGGRGAPVHVTLPSATASGKGPSHANLDVKLPLADLRPGPCTITVSVGLPSGPTTSRVVPCSIESPR